MSHRTPIYRAPMRDEYGLERGIVGIAAGRGDRAARRLHRFATLPEGVFVWTRDRAGGYWLGRISGPLREDPSAPAQAAGIAHVRPVTWLERPFAEGEVPAAVARTFARGGHNFQRTHDADAERRTAELWGRFYLQKSR